MNNVQGQLAEAQESVSDVYSWFDRLRTRSITFHATMMIAALFFRKQDPTTMLRSRIHISIITSTRECPPHAAVRRVSAVVLLNTKPFLSCPKLAYRRPSANAD
jgi:hypothetical protein